MVFFTQRLKNFVLGGYSDVDFAGSIDDRASTSGYLMNMGSAAVSWSCKKNNGKSVLRHIILLIHKKKFT